VDGNAGTIPPAQIESDVPKLKTGTISGLIVTVNVVGNAHNPAVGVNVYVPDAWLLMTAGVHVPVIPFVDVVGNNGTVLPAQAISEEPNANAGTSFGLMVTKTLVGVAH
jgi:hypothetical protein